MFLTDTTGWMEIAGTYVGQGNEIYMLIGYVGRSTYMDLQNSNPQGAYEITYFYIDDVAVTPCDQQMIDLQPIDTVICIGEILRLRGYPTAIRHFWDKYGDTPTIDVSEPGTYTVTSFLGLGCTAITTEYRVRQDPCDCSIQVPTLYSELYDRDGIEISVNRRVESLYLQLYDAHGQFMLDTETYTIPDRKLPIASAPYFWIVAIQCRDGNDALFTRMQRGKIIIQN